MAIVPVVLAAAALMAVQAGAVDDVRGLRHPRDASGYSDYLRTYVGQDSDSTTPAAGPADRAWVDAHRAAALAAGEAACQWLRSQPHAPRVDPTRSWDGPYTLQTVLNRFADSPSEQAQALSRSGRATVAVAAWEYLCQVDREKHTAATGLPDD